jgi:uncharacterized protein (DUF2237 family)
MPQWERAPLDGKETLQAGRAPRVVLRAAHESSLRCRWLADLKRLAVDLD